MTNHLNDFFSPLLANQVSAPRNEKQKLITEQMFTRKAMSIYTLMEEMLYSVFLDNRQTLSN